MCLQLPPDDTERRLRERLDAHSPAPRAELLHVLMRGLRGVLHEAGRVRLIARLSGELR